MKSQLEKDERVILEALRLVRLAKDAEFYRTLAQVRVDKGSSFSDVHLESVKKLTAERDRYVKAFREKIKSINMTMPEVIDTISSRVVIDETGNLQLRK